MQWAEWARPQGQARDVRGLGGVVILLVQLILVRIEFDPDKRDRTLAERGLDLARAGEVFAGKHWTVEDERHDYNEPRYITAGRLDGRMVLLAWTPRGQARRIISMRKANEREQKRYAHRMD
ncbi:MAG: BrnT family toxin [Desulfovibrionaceae bacterium]|jgi:uncharacterized DUF497 family protein|nr:BrnT family toxin [Desulfovibrionaceae bacterium]